MTTEALNKPSSVPEPIKRVVAAISRSSSEKEIHEAIANTLYYGHGVKEAREVTSVLYRDGQGQKLVHIRRPADETLPAEKPRNHEKRSLNKNWFGKYSSADRLNDDAVYFGSVRRERYVDAQSDIPAMLKSGEVERRAPEDILRDEAVSTKERIAAFGSTIVSNPQAAAEFAFRQIQDEDTSLEWLPTLVYGLEELRFDDPDEQEVVWKSLLRIAFYLRQSNAGDFRHVTWSAIRRCASLIPEDRIDELLPLLANEGKVDTRLVGLQAIATVFTQIPGTANQHPNVADRVYALAEKFVDRDVIIPGENSSIAELAILCLTALSDERLRPIAEDVANLGMAWLSRSVAVGIRGLVCGWENNQSPAYIAAIEAAQLLEHQIVEPAQ